MPYLLCHLFGDYVLQSSWMANNKTKQWIPAIVHVLVYLIPFLLVFHPSVKAIAVIGGTHLLMDRFRLARYIAFLTNFLAPPTVWPSWEDCKATGYHKNIPTFLAVWLMIIVDNTAHLTINYFALTHF